MVTQQQIAETLGLDVSSVNKILNGVRGPKFRDKTIRRVFSTARLLGYSLTDRRGKGVLRATLEHLFQEDIANDILAASRGVTLTEVVRIKRMLYRTAKEGMSPD